MAFVPPEKASESRASDGDSENQAKGRMAAGIAGVAKRAGKEWLQPLVLIPHLCDKLALLFPSNPQHEKGTRRRRKKG